MIVAFNLCGRQNGNLFIIGDKAHRFHRFFQISARTHIGHVHRLQRVQAVQKGNLPVIVGMVIGKRNNIHPHFRQVGCAFRLRPESKLLARGRRPPVSIGKFIVYHKNIGIPHFRQQIRGKSLLKGAAPLLKPCHHRIGRVKQNISCKGHQNLIRRSRFPGINPFLLHALRIAEQLTISALIQRLLRFIALCLFLGLFHHLRKDLFSAHCFLPAGFIFSIPLFRLLAYRNECQKDSSNRKDRAEYGQKKNQFICSFSLFLFFLCRFFICIYCHNRMLRKIHTGVSDKPGNFLLSDVPSPPAST